MLCDKPYGTITLPNLSIKTATLSVALLERVLKCNFNAEGIENLSDNPTVFVINHFTRTETVIVPCQISKYTKKYVHSLADESLFLGKFGEFLSSLGVISTSEPQRDNLIIGDLICGRQNWVIYPEGRMVKNKSIINKNRLLKFHADPLDKLHTGGAILALKTEIYKQQLQHALASNDIKTITDLKERFNITDIERISDLHTEIVPITISYYPLRPGPNLIKKIAEKFFGKLPDRLTEELEIEGNILLRNTDINIYFGNPISVKDYLNNYFLLTTYLLPFFRSVDKTNQFLKYQGKKFTRLFMGKIYRNIKINIDHLFCTALHSYKGKIINENHLRTALFLSTESLSRRQECRLHWTLTHDRISIVLDDLYSPLNEIKELAVHLGILQDDQNGNLIIHKENLNETHKFHSIRQKNMVKVIANEVKPVKPVIKSVCKYINFNSHYLDRLLVKKIYELDCHRYQEDYEKYYKAGISKSIEVGNPIFLNSDNRSTGIVLAHGLLSAPMEVRLLAEFLHDKGYTVYCIRLPGHGTEPNNLCHVKWNDWYEAYLRGVALIRTHCDSIVYGGFSTGGLLALLAASHYPLKLKGIFTVNSPIDLASIKAEKSVAANMMDDIKNKSNKQQDVYSYIDTKPENPDINYNRLYLKALRELRLLMKKSWSRLRYITVPSLIVHAENDPVVDYASSQKIMSRLKCEDKILKFLDLDHHVIVRNEGCEQVFEVVNQFISKLIPESIPVD